MDDREVTKCYHWMVRSWILYHNGYYILLTVIIFNAKIEFIYTWWHLNMSENVLTGRQTLTHQPNIVICNSENTCRYGFDNPNNIMQFKGMNYQYIYLQLVYQIHHFLKFGGEMITNKSTELLIAFLCK